jgi:DeoR/GlpR family transcriptional regulator of sugar metabolism
MKQKALTRRDEILRMAMTTGLASVEELSAAFDVTPSTIRRDLTRLTTQGKLARTYGGAISLANNREASLTQRLGEAHEAKRAIARWAFEQVQAGESIALVGGSSTAALAEELRSHTDLSGVCAVTAGLTAMESLAHADHIDVLALGGRLRALSQSFIGSLAEAAVSRMSFDRAFMGADSVHAERGICEASLDQTRLKELIMERADHVYVLAHAAKLGQSAFHAWAVMPKHWTLVTDQSADPGLLAAFSDRGVEVALATALS